MELWSRTWALTDRSKQYRRKFENLENIIVDDEHRGPIWIYIPSIKTLRVNGSERGGENVNGFSHSSLPRQLVHVPLPLKHRPAQLIECDGLKIRLEWPSLPERPRSNHSPQTQEETLGHELFIRAYSVWDRLRDVDTALADPACLWEELRRRWTSVDASEPQMDIIVQHAIDLKRILEELNRQPRRILRRTHQQVPLSRVQELDRRSMTWLVRQPGISLAERGGDRQSILAVAREENFDTLENRVLRAYCELASFVSTEYLARNYSKLKSRRALLVDSFGRRCKRFARDLDDRGVRLAEPGVVPNFVLQQNPRYHSIWSAWNELLNRDLIKDDLWRWQGRSWEEFCALAVMVALVGIPGAKLVASAPLVFLQEQKQGRWLEHDNPLGAFYLEKQGLVVEVRFDMEKPGTDRSDFGAPIWISVGKTDDIADFLSYVAVWPIWDHYGGIVPSEAAELNSILSPYKKNARITSALVLRPSSNSGEQFDEVGSVLTVAIGTQGRMLHKGIERLSDFFSSLIVGDVKK